MFAPNAIVPAFKLNDEVPDVAVIAAFTAIVLAESVVIVTLVLVRADETALARMMLVDEGV